MCVHGIINNNNNNNNVFNRHGNNINFYFTSYTHSHRSVFYFLPLFFKNSLYN